ncbi:MAG: hypothetical protein KA746_08950 [Pyrinomonadaceae bacterium]|nr:hypothetical protein [Pyrinomonadaceae bacterium]MBP6212422.1 hypothetical protein [Pyrinomonadaceae bacterium]
MKRLLLLAAIAACFAILPDYASAQTKTRVRFARGTHSGVVKGTIRGYAYRDYLVGSGAGEMMEVSIDATNDGTVFTIFRPDGSNIEGAAETVEYKGQLGPGGDYVIRVGMMRSAARRKGATSTYTLKIMVQ